MITKQALKHISTGKRVMIFLLFFLCPIISSAQQGRLYAVCVGVSEYAQSSDNLPYARQDAWEMYNLLSLHAPKTNLRLLIDRHATVANVLHSLNELFTATRPEDIVIFFFSGHGWTGAFYLHDQFVYFDSLKVIFQKTKAKRKIIFADACYSGTFRSDKTPNNSNAGNHIGDNVLLFLASRSNQYSYESYELKNGTFAYYLLKGLKGAVDANRDKIIAAKELFNYVHPKVKEYSRGKQIPVMWGKFSDKMPVLNRTKKVNH
jgi:uncharacterized caspase-like protein